MAKTVVVQKWEESELGWGCRPDGYSIHVSEEALAKYVHDYWESMPNTPPSEYSRPDGTPYSASISEEEYHKLVETGGSLRSYNGAYPGSGGIDGWRPVK